MKNRIRAFGHAFRGIGNMFSETHFRIHLIALIAVVVAGFYYSLDTWEWASILIISALVLSLEAMNSALENLADATIPDPHPLIKQAKDSAAGAVLIASILAIALAAVIFTPHILHS